MDFLWHEVSEKEKQEIQKQAKQIMKSFSEKLAKIPEIDKVNEPLIERPEGEREESVNDKERAKCGCMDFSREIMFENAPETKGDFIVAEKGGWKE